jgi:hypothetical protein
MNRKRYYYDDNFRTAAWVLDTHLGHAVSVTVQTKSLKDWVKQEEIYARGNTMDSYDKWCSCRVCRGQRWEGWGCDKIER